MIDPMSDAPRGRVFGGPGLLERERELGNLDASITAAIAGDASVVLVSGSPLVSFELRHIGGALGREEPGHGAIASLSGRFLTFGVGIVFGEESFLMNRATLNRVRELLTPYNTGRKYLNFTEQETDPALFYAPETWGRLRALKAEVDPAQIFRANHSIDPAD
jgi:hypothetical protein